MGVQLAVMTAWEGEKKGEKITGSPLLQQDLLQSAHRRKRGGRRAHIYHDFGEKGASLDALRGHWRGSAIWCSRRKKEAGERGLFS